MSRRPCAHCQRLWSAQTLVTVGAAELCPVCYRLGRVAAPCWGLYARYRQDGHLPR